VRFNSETSFLMTKTAIILGGTGLTGRILLNKLLVDGTFERIKLFSRSSVHIDNPKIEEHLIDMFTLEDHSEDFTGDVVFCCIGTTNAKTPDKNRYLRIDYGIPIAAARLSRDNKIDAFIVISSMGADPTSKVFYNKTKGEMERDVLQFEIENTYILQPSLIGGNRTEIRRGEVVAKFMMGSLDFLIPKKYKMIHPESIAKAMIWLSKNGFSETRISSEKIKEIATGYI
jgi:uncharacterized protein YbjT (DUF2867 family)